MDMGVFEDAAVKAKEMLDVAGAKTNEIINVQKLRFKLSSLNSQLSKDFELLGRMQYDFTKAGEAVDSMVADQITKIDNLKADIAEVERNIAEEKGEKICKVCRTPQEAGNMFCSRCGQKLNGKPGDAAASEAGAAPGDEAAGTDSQT